MKKRCVIMAIVLGLLTACGVEESPEAYFDRALTKVEESDQISSHFALQNSQDDVALIDVEVKGTQLLSDQQIELSVAGNDVSAEYNDDLKALCCFDLLANVFTDFSMNESAGLKEVYFTIPESEYDAYSRAFVGWIQAPFEMINGMLSISGENEIKTLLLTLQTSAGNYEVRIEMEDIK